MKYLLLSFFTLFIANTYAQYYYNEVFALKQNSQHHQQLKLQNIKKVTAVSYENGTEKTEKFSVTQTILPNASSITTITSYPSTGTNYNTSNYNNYGLITVSKDSSGNVISNTSYTYNGNAIIEKNIATKDAFMDSYATEKYLWQYEGNSPIKLLKIKNNTDTTFIFFMPDDKGNIVEERWFKKNRNIETYYYYYNANNTAITDVVRYNSKAKRLLPDFLLEYDAEGRITQQTQMIIGTNNYLIWKYIYGSNGLKNKELCLNKQQQLIGTIEYIYE